MKSITAVLLVVMLVAALILIPAYGHIGAAFAMLIQRAAFFATISVYGMKQLRQLARGQTENSRF